MNCISIKLLQKGSLWGPGGSSSICTHGCPSALPHQFANQLPILTLLSHCPTQLFTAFDDIFKVSTLFAELEVRSSQSHSMTSDVPLTTAQQLKPLRCCFCRCSVPTHVYSGVLVSCQLEVCRSFLGGVLCFVNLIVLLFSVTGFTSISELQCCHCSLAFAPS